MFRSAIEKVGNFTRPIHFISNYYGDKNVRPGAATLFFINDQGYALTCKHVTAVIKQAEGINTNYNRFQDERSALQRSGSFNKKIKEIYDKEEDEEESNKVLKTIKEKLRSLFINLSLNRVSNERKQPKIMKVIHQFFLNELDKEHNLSETSALKLHSQVTMLRDRAVNYND